MVSFCFKRYSDPGFTLVIPWSGHVSVDVGSCLFSCLHPFLLCMWGIGCVGQVCFRLVEFRNQTSCPDFWPVRSSGGVGARAEITPIQYLVVQWCELERRVGSSSGVLVLQKCWASAFCARAGGWPLERKSVSVRSSGVFYARAEDWV